MGLPCTFVRLAGCNLNCTKETAGFDCDSTYAFKGKKLTIQQVVNRIIEEGNTLIIWTGGEPLLQIREIETIYKVLCRDEPRFKYIFHIETNGTLISRIGSIKHIDTIIISLKKHTIPILNFREMELVLGNQKIYWKFVIGTKKDFIFWHNIIKNNENLIKYVYLMPAGVEDSILKEISLWLVEKCKKYKYGFSPRLQIWLWGNKRGV